MAALITALATALAGPPDIVIVSLDTTRADALTCYGDPPVPFHDAAAGTPRTPVLDALAADGLRFAQLHAHAPSTLSSHASLFSGRDPHGTGVVRNGYPLDADVPLLAERLAAAGWDTRAVLGAAALEKGTGIERGFAHWDDESPTLRGLMYQSPANEVVDRALRSASEREPGKPLFLFVHLFDAHSPYEPPEPYRQRFASPGYDGVFTNPEAPMKPLVDGLRSGTAEEAALAAVNGRYLGEVAWMDAQVGRLLTGLEASGVLGGDALFVVVGDHGEVLSEDPIYAWTHGNNVSEGVLRVPLLMRAWGDVPLARHRVVEAQAPISQLAPTLERLAGLEPTLGTDFWDLVRPGPVAASGTWPEHGQRPIFLEATRPRSLEATDRWNNLPFQRGVLAGGYRLEAHPAHGDPPHMAAGEPGPLQYVLSAMLAAWDAAAPGPRTAEMPEHTRRALEALGYLQDD
ncbi:MAG: sulfatase [Myxococcota bacterium]